MLLSNPGMGFDPQAAAGRRAGHIPLLPRCPATPVPAILRLSVPGNPTPTTTEIAMTRALGLLMLPAAVYSNLAARSSVSKGALPAATPMLLPHDSN